MTYYLFIQVINRIIYCHYIIFEIRLSIMKHSLSTLWLFVDENFTEMNLKPCGYHLWTFQVCIWLALFQWKQSYSDISFLAMMVIKWWNKNERIYFMQNYVFIVIQKGFPSTKTQHIGFKFQNAHFLFETSQKILTHLPLVLHICVSESGQHWFR